MKWLKRIFYLLTIVLLVACNNRSGNMQNNVSSGNSQETFEDFYKKLNVISLPFFSTSSGFWERSEFIPLPSGIYNSVYDTTDVRINARIAKLPSIHGLDVITAYYQDRVASDIVELYTLKDAIHQIDRLRIYEVETIRDNSLVIREEFIIEEDYRIRTSKYMQDLLIEQIYYTITEEGHFEEIRDGKTSVIAYEMYLNSDSLTVESFVWDITPSGGLRKKDLVRQVYDINDYY